MSTDMSTDLRTRVNNELQTTLLLGVLTLFRVRTIPSFVTLCFSAY